MNTLSTLTQENTSISTNEINTIGFFPGLGSRTFYKDICDDLYSDGSVIIKNMYKDAAEALNLSGSPESLLITNSVLPQERLKKQSFLATSFVLHNLALEMHTKEYFLKKGVKLNTQLYTGESFGIIAAAIAAKSLSVYDGMQIIDFITKAIYRMTEGIKDPETSLMIPSLEKSTHVEMVSKNSAYVVALQGEKNHIESVLSELKQAFRTYDIEINKYYSQNQTNIYLNPLQKNKFSLLIKKYPEISYRILKEPTTFLAHSKRLSALRNITQTFFKQECILFYNPTTPIISNHSNHILQTGDEVREAVLAIIDEPMQSRFTSERINQSSLNYVIEYGIGKKSISLLEDNQSQKLLFPLENRTKIELLYETLLHIENMHHTRHEEALSSLSFLYSQKITIDKNNVTKLLISRHNNAEQGKLSDLVKTNHLYKQHLNEGELVLSERTRKSSGSDKKIESHLTILKGKDISTRVIKDSVVTEKSILHFSDLDHLWDSEIETHIDKVLAEKDTTLDALSPYLKDREAFREKFHSYINKKSPISRVLLQILSFNRLASRYPYTFQKEDTILTSSSLLGWIGCLIFSKSKTLEDSIDLFNDLLDVKHDELSLYRIFSHYVSQLNDTQYIFLSPNGNVVTSKEKIRQESSNFFINNLHESHNHFDLDCNSNLITFSSSIKLHTTSDFKVIYNQLSSNLLSSTDPQNKKLNTLELNRSCFLTSHNKKVKAYSAKRKLITSTINAYIKHDETLVQFCSGGSESMTMFVTQEDSSDIIVKKILSEKLTAAKWNPEGKGVMLPPFTKAARQVDYLNALPESAKPYFPAVFSVEESESPSDKGSREVIYLMSHVPGLEVSQFIKQYRPDPRITSAIYREIHHFLSINVHSHRVQKNTFSTLNISYFKKIEDRLKLCRRTAPSSFSEEFIKQKNIRINGIEYLNIEEVLKKFRASPYYQSILEPKFHSLVMGDTNTENIKIANIEPLLDIQKRIKANEDEHKIDELIRALSYETIDLRFLDPRAIGYESEGKECRDDYMYDNKPWHNSLGHYDEIHNELFDIHVGKSKENSLKIDIDFHSENPFQSAYKVQDITEKRIKISDVPELNGIERHFSNIMGEIYHDNSDYVKNDPFWLIRFVFIMGTHFAAMPPFHFKMEEDGTIIDSYEVQKRPLAIYCEGIKWLNWCLQMLDGTREEFLGIQVPKEVTLNREVI